MRSFKDLREKTLTPAEKKKREEIAKAMERDNPGMDMKKKMAIATWQAKKVAEEVELHESPYLKAAIAIRNAATTHKLTGDDHSTMMHHNSLLKSKDPKDHQASARKAAKLDTHLRDIVSDAIHRNSSKDNSAKWHKSAGLKRIKEESELEEGIENMSHARLKWHMNTGVPHGSYTKDEMKKERDRRLSKVDTHAAYKKAKPSMNEESELEEGLYHVEYGRSGKMTHQVVAKDAKDAHQKAMAHLKKKNPKLAHPDYADTFNKPSITHIKGNEPRADKYKTEATEIDEISLSHLSNTIAKSTGTKNVKTAMKPGEIKKGLDDLKKRLATLGQDPKLAKEAYEEEPASPDEKSMAMRQAKFIQYVGDEIMEHLEQDGDFPEWMQNKLSEFHQKAKDMHSTMAGSYEDDKEEMDEAAPKMKGDWLKKERERNRAHDAAMGRTPTGRKKPVRQMTSTQRSLAKMRSEDVISADKKPEKFVKPDGKVGIRMVRVDKKVVDKDA